MHDDALYRVSKLTHEFYEPKSFTGEKTIE